MDFSIQASLLIRLLRENGCVPSQLAEIIKNGSSAQYLNILADLALQSKYTSFIFATHSSLFVEISNIWLESLTHGHETILAVYSRVLHLAPNLRGHIRCLFDISKNDIIGSLKSKDTSPLLDLPVERLQPLLLSFFRLLNIDNATYADEVSPANLLLLLSHRDTSIRYLAVRILALYLHASDARLESMIQKHCGQGAIQGQWDGKTIDYALLSLQERTRLRILQDYVELSRSRAERGSADIPDIHRPVKSEVFSPQTVLCGQVLMPTSLRQDRHISNLVFTGTTITNMERIAEGINSLRPVLVRGVEGSGKSTLIKEIASMTGRGSTMISLHVNEQIDTKLLLGTYTSGKLPGVFEWQPGILTKAVSEGRWVLIEDLDHAPQEFMSVLLSLIQRRELLLPNQSKPIRCAEDFQLIATVRTRGSHITRESSNHLNPKGFGDWHHVQLLTPSEQDLTEIISSSFPLVKTLLPKLMQVYAVCKDIGGSKSSSALCGPLHLIRLCRRIQRLARASSLNPSSAAMTEGSLNDCFLEAVEVFSGALPNGLLKNRVVSRIAEEMHIPPHATLHLLDGRAPSFSRTKTSLRVGRVSLESLAIDRREKAFVSGRQSRVAPTNHFLRSLESVAVSVQQAESCLLVGETGTGKTTLVQYLAEILGYRLVILNLSPQTEVGDLLGGYKPMNPRKLANPLKQAFDDLIHLTFPTRENHKFVQALSKAINKANWSRALSLWEEALRTVRPVLDSPSSDIKASSHEPNNKRRRIQVDRVNLKNRWTQFEDEVASFRKFVARGIGGFAFSFVESNLVQAAKNGDWVLLDEINLSSPDVLDIIADLFGSGQVQDHSMFLPEAGHVERVPVHGNFRIFGAMNPATDVGKKNLPPSIRSKFTEIFIDQPDQDMSNLISITKLYLESQCQTDAKIAGDIAALHVNIKRLQNDGALVDGTSQKTNFSLRTFTRAVLFAADMVPIYGPRRALFEGFSMCYLTALSIKSITLVEPLIEHHVLGTGKRSVAILRRHPLYPDDGKKYVKFEGFWIAKGEVAVKEQPQYVLTPSIKRNLRNVVRAVCTRRFPIMLQGPTASGKTSMIEYLAQISGNTFVRVNNHEHTDLQEYLGTYTSDVNGQLAFQDGVLAKALKEGHWIVLDELNLAPTDVLEALNRLLDDNRELLIPETQEVVRPHENFVLFATQNPAGLYGGRKVLSRAFRNRFLEIHFDDIPEEDLRIILHERCSIAPSFCSNVVDVYKRISLLRQRSRLFQQRNSFATLRDLFRWAMRSADNREWLALNGLMILGERVRDGAEQTAILRTIEEVTKTKIDMLELYSPARCKILDIDLKTHSHGVIWTRSMRRLVILVKRALEHNEPVLLIGETGCGKTTICQVVAEMMETQLRIVNAHQNMESGDLIGSQRPVRHRGEARNHLIQLLVETLQSCDFGDKRYGRNLEELTAAYDRLLETGGRQPTTDVQQRVEDLRIRSRALFEWSDGEVVSAMKQGHHFLLDEISLADDSVIERLNSLLESDRTLYLSEKGTKDNLVAAANGFQFLATMNPGGDYGKRELSAALRNRFTEIWVPPLSDPEELAQIIRAKLLPMHKPLAVPMVTFAAWFAQCFGAPGAYPSIRSLISWSRFISVQDKMDNASAILHGACLVFLDSLGTRPTNVAVSTNSSVPEQRRRCMIKLQELFDIRESCVVDSIPDFDEDELALAVGPFKLAKRSVVAPHSRYNLEAPTTLKNAMKILRALTVGKPILLEGDPGVGKTSLVSALAERAGIALTRINLSDQTDLVDLFGTDTPIEGAGVGDFAWRDGQFLKAMQNGGWVMLDEMNLASQSVLEGLNACFDHRGQVFIPELNETFTKHPGFAAFATQNPHRTGAGRKGLPASFVNRFTVVYAEAFHQEDMMAICKASFPCIDVRIVGEVVKCVQDLGLALRENPALTMHGGPWETNLRDSLRWLDILSDTTTNLASLGSQSFKDVLFTQRFRRPEDRQLISKVIDDSIGRNALSRPMQLSQSSQLVQAGICFAGRDVTNHAYSRGSTLSNHALPLMESMFICVQKNYPILLVGSDTTGRRQLINKTADLLDAELMALHLHPETDTSDLIGGYEQSEATRMLSSFFHRLDVYTRGFTAERLCSDTPFPRPLLDLISSRWGCDNLDGLHPVLQALALALPDTQFLAFATELGSLAREQTQIMAARFEWMDGRLCEAMKLGKWFVLEDANLCSAAVLDRLSSLLESGAFLAINEHPDINGNVERLEPHPSFRIVLTMDPRHGELSPAMRNRCIELFVPPEAAENSSAMIRHPFECEPRLSRFLPLQDLNWNDVDESLWPWIMFVCLDHLSLSDLDLLDQYKQQVNIDSDIGHMLQTAIEIYQQAFPAEGPIIRAIQRLYLDAFRDSPDQWQRACLQTLHPLNNTLTVDLAPKIEALARWFDLLQDTYFVARQMASLSERLKSGSRMQSSLEIQQKPIMTRNLMEQVVEKMQSLLLYIRDLLEASDPVSSEQDQLSLVVIEEVLGYIWFFAQNTQQGLTDSTFLDCLLALSRDIGIKFRRNTMVEEHNDSGAVSQLLRRLNSLFLNNATRSGFALDSLWRALLPMVPRSQRQYEIMSNVINCAKRFDEIKWSSGADLSEQAKIESSLLMVFKNSGQFHSSPADWQKVLNALQDLEHISKQDIGRFSPFFTDEFGILKQYVACGAEWPEQSKQEINMFLGESSISSHHAVEGSLLYELEMLNTALLGLNPQTGFGIIHNELLNRILSKTRSISEVPAGSLDILGSELNSMAKATTIFCSQSPEQHIRNLCQRFDRIRSMTMATLEDVFNYRDLKEIDKYTRQVYGKIMGHNSQDMHQSSAAKEEQSLSFLQTSIDLVLSSPSQGNDTAHTSITDFLAQTPLLFSQFFTGLILLFLPEWQYDPAKKLLVTREYQESRIGVLQHKRVALKIFDRLAQGNNGTHRMALVKRALNSIELIPETDLVHRPMNSNFKDLQGDLSSTLRLVVSSALSMQTFRCPTSANLECKDDIAKYRNEIQIAISRLSRHHDDFGDISRPLSTILAGLSAGLGLQSLAIAKADARPIDVESYDFPSLLQRISILGANDSVHSNSLPNHDSQIRAKVRHLEALALIRCSEGSIPPKAVDSVLESFDAIYRSWKNTLRQKQEAGIKQGSLYRYRDLSNEQDGEEVGNAIREIFMQDEGIEGPSPSGPESTISAITDMTASLHRKLFGAVKKIVEQQKYSNRDVVSEFLQFETGDCPNPNHNENLLPALLHELDDQVRQIEGFTEKDGLYDFYHDANVGEVRKLVHLVKSTRSKFLELKSEWPDHATVHDVLLQCRQLLELRHSIPLSYLMVKLEQLHASVYQWQDVSSRQYTAVTQYDALTQTIIKWRRLELTTWARLLDLEDEKCRNAADAWWFVAYENLIAAPLSLDPSRETLDSFAPSLLATLEQFLTVTSVGQFTHRIEILKLFMRHILLIPQLQSPSFSLSSALGNLIDYFIRYIESVRNYIMTERKKLEVELKEILLLASWKDTNVAALKESAKRSHYKLVKTIGKYRKLLVQPVEGFLSTAVQWPEISGVQEPTPEGNLPPRLESGVEEAYQASLIGWHDRPARYTNPIATARKVQEICKFPSEASSLVHHAETYAIDLRHQVRFLQKQNSQNDVGQGQAENKHDVIQKRNLLLQTLKDLRKMGFKPSLSQGVQAQQESLSNILSCLPDTESMHSFALKTEGDNFYSSVEHILAARAGIKAHHNDLRHTEVTRSLGCLENLLSTLISQRKSIGSAASNVSAMQAALEKMRNIWKSHEYHILPQSAAGEEEYEAVCRAVKWMPSLLDTAKSNTEIYSKYSEHDSSGISRLLTDHKQILDECNSKIEKLPSLPRGLVSSAHENTYDEIRGKLRDLGVDIDRQLQEVPALKPFLNQIKLSTKIEGRAQMSSNGTVVSMELHIYDFQIRRFIDRLLVSSQNIENGFRQIPRSVQDAGWLQRMTALFTDSLDSAHVGDLHQDLEHVLRELHLVHDDTNGNLREAAALCSMSLPIVQTFVEQVVSILQISLRLHYSLSDFALFLSRTFISIEKDGFCRPRQGNAESSGEEKLEDGSGLGEGVGEQNASGQIEGDEELSELAQANHKDKDLDSIDDDNNAVDMADDDLEGELKDISEDDSVSDGASEEDGAEPEEHIGDVDELDPGAVDEKLWNSAADESNRQGQRNQNKSGKEVADTAVDNNEQTQGNNEEQADGPEDKDDDELSQRDNTVTREDVESLRPHQKQNEMLDASASFDLHDLNSQETTSQSDDQDLADMSDAVTNDLHDDIDTEPESMDEFDTDISPEQGAVKQDDKHSLEDGLDGDHELPSNALDQYQDSRSGNTWGGKDGTDAGHTDDELEGEVSDFDSGMVLDLDDQQDSTHGSEDKDSHRTEKNRPSKTQASEGGLDGERGRRDLQDEGNSKEDLTHKSLRRLGEALEQWQRKQSQILEPSANRKTNDQQLSGEDPTNGQVEHLGDEDDDGDGQAMGMASKEEAIALDQQAFEREMSVDDQKDPKPPPTHPDQTTDQIDRNVEGEPTIEGSKQMPRLFVGERIRDQQAQDHESDVFSDHDMDIDQLDQGLSITHINHKDSERSAVGENVHQQWSLYDQATHVLALSLTEELRLILEPTQAARLRGDYRTGKRLNMKRIIPYIASQYKRDKIWMRRSVPSKRNYQIMIAVDDSKSMQESGSRALAFESLAMITKSLTMLEVGQVSIVSFGADVAVAHEFDKTFTPDAGAQLLNTFGFQQTKTNVHKLVAKSIGLFQEARRKALHSPADLWQLEIIISDGICENHDAIQRLVRQAQDERIMIVFVILDSLHPERSIVDMNQAVFENNDNGDSKIKIKRYLDEFPFPYYVIVGDVRDLPSVLAQALKQWFAEVMDAS